jgi:hypothetical protein
MIFVLWAELPLDSRPFVEAHSSELTILLLAAMVLGTLLVLVPRLLRARMQSLEMEHAERMKALDQGMVLPRYDHRSVAAGRTAYMVPMVVFITAGTVTCFLTAYRDEHLFHVTLTVWSVACIVSLAAITGGVALMGRLAQLDEGDEEEEVPKNPLQG